MVIKAALIKVTFFFFRFCYYFLSIPIPEPSDLTAIRAEILAFEIFKNAP